MQEESNTADKMVVQDKRSIYYVRYPNLAIYYCFTMASGHYLPILYHRYWLLLKLKEGSDVQGWFSTLPSHEQAKMHGHWVDYLRGIKEGYLGRQWQFDIGEEYKSQYFCQPGYENELPKMFITRHIMYARMLVKSDNGGPLEVQLVMARAPLAWRTILVLEHIKSTSFLYTKASEHASTRTEELAQLLTDYKESYISVTGAPDADRNDDLILTEAYQVMKRRQRAPPPGGYMFTKNNHITTKMGRLPPLPCKCCGSSNHWDKECPDHAIYLEKTTKSGYSNEQSLDKDDKLYQSTYGILLSQRLASMQVDETKLSQQDFEKAVHDD